MDKKRRGAKKLCETLRRNGHRALFAGGCVRDELRDVTPSDYDIATSATPAEVEKFFRRTVGIGAAFGVMLVLAEEGRYEVATFRRDGPYADGRRPSSVTFTGEREDALRRDFTVNAMFQDPESGELLDYVNGQRDLEAGVIRTVGDPRARFGEDYLRLLRAVRFAVQLDFEIEADTMAAIGEMAHLITQTSAERIRDELVKMLTRGGGGRGIALLDETGLLEHVLPEVAKMKGVEQPPEYHPEGDVFVHTLLLMDQLDAPSAALAFGALLHDAGKPRTQTFEDRIRFNNHETVGAKMAEAVCRRLRMPGETVERVRWLVSQHMRVAHAPEMRLSKVKRLVREEGFPELLELFRADCLASHGRMDAYEWLRDFNDTLPEEEARPVALLRGGDLMQMGYAQGPLLGEILTALEDAQLEGKIDTPRAARDFVLKRWPAGDREPLNDRTDEGDETRANDEH